MRKLFARVTAILENNSQLSALFLRLGLAAVFLYAGISSIISPDDWVSYLPDILTDNMSPDVVLAVFSVYELLLAAWLLSGMYVRFAALLCAATLIGIIVSNLSLLQITFRDIGLMLAALALAFSKED